MALPSTATGISGPSISRSGAAAASLTADQVIGQPRSRSSSRASTGSGPSRVHIEWMVTRVGVPCETRWRAASVANGDHTETCTWTAS